MTIHSFLNNPWGNQYIHESSWIDKRRYIHEFILICGGFSTGINMNSWVCPRFFDWPIHLILLAQFKRPCLQAIYNHLSKCAPAADNTHWLRHESSGLCVCHQHHHEDYLRTRMPLGSPVDFALPHPFSTSFWRLRISKSICKSAGELVDWLDESPWKSPYLQHQNAQHRSVLIMISKPYDLFRPWSHLWSSSNWFKHPVIQSPETCRG